MPTQGNSFTNHPGIVGFDEASYYFYHDGALPSGGGYIRSLAVEDVVYNSDCTIPKTQMTTDGPSQVGTLNPYTRHEAETIAWAEGVETEVCSEGGIDVAFINDGDYIKVKGIDFGEGATSFGALVASATNGGNLELHLNIKAGGGRCGPLLSCPISCATGTHDLFF